MNIKRDLSKRKKSIAPIEVDMPRIKIVYDIQSLDLFCIYVTSDNSYIRTSHMANMKRLFDRLDLSIYEKDPDKMERINYIQKGLEARIKKKLKNRVLINKYINGGLDKPSTLKYDGMELSTEEIDWINKTITESLKTGFMYDYVDNFMDLCTRFKSSDYGNKTAIVNEFEHLIDNAKIDLRKVKNEALNDMEFTLEDGLFEESITDIYQKETNPSRRLLTGMQGFNEITGGGLESGRVYMLFGMAGAGKSLTILNLAYQIKKYNKNYECKDKTKKPCIVLLTMENTVHETVTRLFSIIANDRMFNYSVEDVINKLRVDGELYLNDDSPINLYIKYKPNMSCDTTYLYDLWDKLDERGYEMICLFQDHIKRIRPAYMRNDIRLDLGEVINDFKVFASEKDIPVISDSHLNRDGARIVDKAKTKQDITRFLGRSNVGESMLMIDNTDCGLIINKEYDVYGKLYMVFYRQKMRDKCTTQDYIAQPFVAGSTIRLVEDFFEKVPLFKTTLYEEKNYIEAANNRLNAANGGFNIRSVIDDDDDDNIYSTKNISSSVPNIITNMAQSNMSIQQQFNQVYRPPLEQKKDMVLGITFDNV